MLKGCCPEWDLGRCTAAKHLNREQVDQANKQRCQAFQALPEAEKQAWKDKRDAKLAIMAKTRAAK